MTLTHAQITRLTALLDKRYRALVAEVRAEVERSEGEDSVDLFERDPADEADQSVSDLQADLNLTLIDRHAGELRDIELARTRIREGCFGRCVDCDEDIDVKRLLACPTAKRCAACQQQRERTYVHAETPTL